MKLYVFHCANHSGVDQFAGQGSVRTGDTIKTISLPCAGKIDVPYLIKAFETGADGVVVVTCRKGECRHIEGSPRAHKRAEAVESLLEEIGFGSGRMAVFESGSENAGQVVGQIRQFVERVRQLPPAQTGGDVNRKPENMLA